MSFFELTTHFLAKKFEIFEFSIFAGPDKNFSIVFSNSQGYYLSEKIQFGVRFSFLYLQGGPEVGSPFENLQFFPSKIDSLKHWMLIGQKTFAGNIIRNFQQTRDNLFRLSVWPTCDQKNAFFRADDDFFRQKIWKSWIFNICHIVKKFFDNYF